MNIIIAPFLCALVLLATCPLFSESQKAQIENSENKCKLDVEVAQGIRRDKLRWSISGRNHKPDIISELTFKNITIYETRLITKLTCQDYFTKLNLGYGHVLDRGRVRDSDFRKSGRRGEFSRSSSKIKGSYTVDTQLYFGKDIQLASDTTLSPLFGYLWQYEKLRFKNGKQTRLFGFKVHERIEGLNSTFKSRWDGPFVGLGAKYQVTKSLFFYGEYDFLFALAYHGHGFWNLRNNGHGMHFHQHSNRWRGWGQIGLLGIGYEIVKNLSIRVEGQLLRFEARGGRIHAKEEHHNFHQPFHKATLNSSEGRLALDYAF